MKQSGIWKSQLLVKFVTQEALFRSKWNKTNNLHHMWLSNFTIIFNHCKFSNRTRKCAEEVNSMQKIVVRITGLHEYVACSYSQTFCCIDSSPLPYFVFANSLYSQYIPKFESEQLLRKIKSQIRGSTVSSHSILGLLGTRLWNRMLICVGISLDVRRDRSLDILWASFDWFYLWLSHCSFSPSCKSSLFQ